MLISQITHNFKCLFLIFGQSPAAIMVQTETFHCDWDSKSDEHMYQTKGDVKSLFAHMLNMGNKQCDALTKTQA